MGRPRKRKPGETPTKDQIFFRALELFAERGYDAVSVRDITRSLGLNEATLYIHFTNKNALLDAILAHLSDSLIDPGFRLPPDEYFQGAEPFDLGDFLVDGARLFFSRTDRKIHLTWRLLMISQFRHESARKSVEDHLLNAPVVFFTAILTRLVHAGRIDNKTDCAATARIIGALFFDFSFRANLSEAWGESSESEFRRLSDDLRTLVRGLV